MQRMKINAATTGVVNGTRQQVVKIYNHCQRHDQPRQFPSRFKEKNRDESGNQKVKGNVKCGVNHGFIYTRREDVTLLEAISNLR